MPRESSKYDNTIVNRHSEAMAHLIDLFVYKGQPRNLDPDREVQILVNHGFVVGFSPSRNQPVWAGYRVAKAIEDVNYARPHLFYDDYRLPPYNQIGYTTFGGGCDRGHMVPNFAINTQFGRLAQMETFFMSNICPQKADLNQGLWMRLEKKIVSEYAQDWEHITTIDDIEQLTKLNLFPTMTSRERAQHESVKAPDIWDNRRLERRGRRMVELWV